MEPEDVDGEPTVAAGRDPALQGIVEHVRAARGVDLGAYKPATLRRRLDKRVEALQLDSYDRYVDHLQVHPDEYPRLFDTVLINVTDFFRDPDAWTELDERHLPTILDVKHTTDPIRVWSAGCSSGQEAYSAAMLLARHLGREGFRDRVKIYATDVDDDALAQARTGVYSQERLSAVPEDLLTRYFTVVPSGNGPSEVQHHQVVPELRHNIIFGHHNVLRDPPISRLDLLICRNTLMYFNADVQLEALSRFHFALREHGLLFLGTAEKLLNHPELFQPADGRRRFFTKLHSGPQRPRLVPRDAPSGGDVVGHLAGNVMLRDAALEEGRTAQIAVGSDGRLALASAMARSMFQITTRDLGRPLQDLEISYRPAELRAAIDRARDTDTTVELRALEWRPTTSEPRYLDIDVVPVHSAEQQVGTLITFTDATDRHRLARRLNETHRELEAARLDLQTTNEELETTNEELQSTVEELETTNEELRSTNEELETMNDELQVTNDELHLANAASDHRGEEVEEVNTFLGAVLRSFRRAVVVVDRELVVRLWNEEAEDLWGLRGEEVTGHHLLNLDVGLPLGELHEPLRRCVTAQDHREELELRALNRRGMAIDCNVVMSSLAADGRQLGAILLMEENRD